jgi:chromosomal replication initiation ATPase DnaA
MKEDQLKAAYLEAVTNELNPDEFIELLKRDKRQRAVLDFHPEEVVCRVMGVPVENIYLRKRDHDSVLRPRQVCMYLRVKYTKDSLKTIGAIYAYNHATVIHANKVITNFVETWPEFAKVIEQIEKELKG